MSGKNTVSIIDDGCENVHIYLNNVKLKDVINYTLNRSTRETAQLTISLYVKVNCSDIALQ